MTHAGSHPVALLALAVVAGTATATAAPGTQTAALTPSSSAAVATTMPSMPSAPSWCAAPAAGAGLLPAVIEERARVDAGLAADQSAARTAVEHAARLACVPAASDEPGALRVEVSALRTDPRFHGTRADDDAGDRLLAQLGAFLERLLASDGMQVFATHTRTVYLATLAVVVAFVAIRLLRARRRTGAHAPRDGSARVERERVRAFAELRAEADAHLARDPRRALLAGRAALLARLGEHDADAIHPSRTSREVVACLAPALSTAAAPCLARFDDAWYARTQTTVDDARGLLALVDAAAIAVDALPVAAHATVPATTKKATPRLPSGRSA